MRVLRLRLAVNRPNFAQDDNLIYFAQDDNLICFAQDEKAYFGDLGGAKWPRQGDKVGYNSGHSDCQV